MRVTDDHDSRATCSADRRIVSSPAAAAAGIRSSGHAVTATDTGAATPGAARTSSAVAARTAAASSGNGGAGDRTRQSSATCAYSGARKSRITPGSASTATAGGKVLAIASTVAAVIALSRNSGTSDATRCAISRPVAAAA